MMSSSSVVLRLRLSRCSFRYASVKMEPVHISAVADGSMSADRSIDMAKDMGWF
jgi:hypothetical protein